MGAPSGLNSGMRAPSGLKSGTGALSSSVWHSHRAILSSPSAVVQGRSSSNSAFSLEAGIVAGSRTWTDVTSSSGSALSLRVAMARWSRRALTLRQRWAQACAPRSGEMVGWALGPEWNCPLHEGGKILSRTIFGRRRSARGV